MEKTLFRRFTFDKFAMFEEKFGEVFLSNARRKKLNNIDFSIISNNCWGGHVYRYYGLNYSSPTVGMYFFADEYIRFLKDLERNIHGSLRMIDAKDSKYAQILTDKKQLHIPVGCINDEIEVVFLHSKTASEAYEKWNRRAERVNFNNLIVKFSEMNLCNEEHLNKFMNMNFKKKVLFLGKSNAYLQEKGAVLVDKYTKNFDVVDDTTYFDKFIDLNELINRRYR